MIEYDRYNRLYGPNPFKDKKAVKFTALAARCPLPLDPKPTTEKSLWHFTSGRKLECILRLC
jgi:hypothetical protein